MRTAPLAGLLVILVAGGACSRSKSPTWTLYRTETVGDTARIHVATFDAVDDEEAYNRSTCERGRELFQVQPGNLARYWCESGRYRQKKR